MHICPLAAACVAPIMEVAWTRFMPCIRLSDSGCCYCIPETPEMGGQWALAEAFVICPVLPPKFQQESQLVVHLSSMLGHKLRSR